MRSSPLYTRLSLLIAEDPELLAVAASSPPNQPAANLFLAALHARLAEQPDHPLARFYPDLTEPDGRAESEGELREALHDFVRTDRAALEHLQATQRVQTNEVNRCAFLMPVFLEIARRESGRPLALIELGCSAGLNLCWDHYGYTYDDGPARDPERAVQIRSVWRGDRRPNLGGPWPTVERRIGLDLNPLDLTNPGDRRWLQALIWPEHAERLARLAAAADVVATVRPRLVRGDAVARWPVELEAVPREVTAVVFHTFVANQFDAAMQERFALSLEAASRNRTFYHVFNNMDHGPEIRVERRGPGGFESTVVAAVEGHGRWIEWLVTS